MNTMQTNLVNLTNNFPYYYLEELLDYANFLKQKSEKENDTDYIESIPGMVDAILEASKEDLKDCSTSLVW